MDFADLPADFDQSIYELDSSHRTLPPSLAGSAVFVQGHNRSDDLFMYLKRPVDGLEPLASYTVSVSIDLATNVPLATFGIGGSPGESVYVKAGASTVEPRAELDDLNYLRMNIDKANQSQSGAQMRVIGNVAHPDFIDDEYRIKELASGPEFLSVSADGEGRAWLIVGTDSGFEGLTPALLRPDRLHSHPLRYALVVCRRFPCWGTQPSYLRKQTFTPRKQMSDTPLEAESRQPSRQLRGRSLVGSYTARA